MCYTVAHPTTLTASSPSFVDPFVPIAPAGAGRSPYTASTAEEGHPLHPATPILGPALRGYPRPTPAAPATRSYSRDRTEIKFLTTDRP